MQHVNGGHGHDNKTDLYFDRFTSWLLRAGLLASDGPVLADLVESAKKNLLLDAVMNPCHVIRKHLYAILSDSSTLRPILHKFTMPTKDDSNYIFNVFYRCNSVIKH